MFSKQGLTLNLSKNYLFALTISFDFSLSLNNFVRILTVKMCTFQLISEVFLRMSSIPYMYGSIQTFKLLAYWKGVQKLSVRSCLNICLLLKVLCSTRISSALEYVALDCVALDCVGWYSYFNFKGKCGSSGVVFYLVTL